MRTRVRQALMIDDGLIDLGVNVVVSGDADSITARPFMNLRWSDASPGMGPVVRRNLVIWVHDQPEDYTRIDRILVRVRHVLLGLHALPTSDGWLNQIRWLTDSGDLANTDRRTILRTSTYEVIGSGM